jgi:Cys-rich repeat protein
MWISRILARTPPTPGSPSRLVRAAWALSLVGAALATLSIASPACIPTDPCLRNSDCASGERCIEGTCAVPPAETPSDGALADGEAGDATDADGVADAADGADAAKLDGDADGTADTDEASDGADAEETEAGDDGGTD